MGGKICFLFSAKLFFSFFHFFFFFDFEVKCDLVRFRHVSIHLSALCFPARAPQMGGAVAGVVFLAWLFSLIKASQPPTTPSTQYSSLHSPKGGKKQRTRGKLGTEEGILMDKEGKPIKFSITG